jgi:outer membrane receptor protein involved in Fe transport
MKYKYTRIGALCTTAMLTVSAGLAFGGVAHAAAATASGAAAAPSQLEEVVVTGSRIPRAGFDTLQPAETVSAQTMQDRGFVNAGDALNELPAFGSQQNTGQQTGSNVGQQFVNLYGLGSQRTLVLVNGRRFVSGNAPTPVGTFGGPPPGQEVDLNDIPTGLIDHIEVLSVGGAPIYGADAIAGTVNIILKNNFQGVNLETQYGVSQHGDGKSYVGRALFGTNFLDDRGNVTLSAEYTQQDGLVYADRPKTLPYATFQPSDACQASGFGACYVPNARVGSIFVGGIPALNNGLANQGAGYPNAIHNAAGQVVAFAPDGTLQPVNLGIQNNGLVFSEGGDGSNLATQSQFMPPVKRTLLDGLAHFDITPHVTAYMETEFSHSEGTQFAAQPSYQSAFFASQNGAGPLQFSTTNPFLTAQARQVLNAAGAQTFYVSRANLDLAPQTYQNQIDTYRVVLGLKGDVNVLDRKINWDTSFNYGRSQGDETYYDINEANFLNAINVTTNAAGQIVCSVTANPPPAPVTGVQPTSVTGCQPLNLFGAGSPSAAARAFVTAQDHAQSLLTQKDFQINVNGSPFDIWAGPVQLAAGFEYRQEGGSYSVDAFAQSGLGRIAPASGVDGSYNSKEYYAEATVPIVSPSMNIPFAYSGDLEGSFRRIDNNLAGKANVFTLGLKFAPVQDIQFRGNLTHSVRAPSIEELFLPVSSANSFAQDPCDPNYINGAAARATNCQKAFAALGTSLVGFKSNVVNASVLGTTGGNPNLLNERANAWTAGFVLRPHFIPRLSIALDWINIHLKDPIEALSLTQVMDACYDSAGFPNTFCNLFTRNAAGQVTGFNAPLANLGAQEFDGAQLDATYGMRVSEMPFISHLGLDPNGDYGDLSFDLNTFFENKHNTETLGVVTKTRGNIGDPKWKVNGSVRYRNGPFMVYLNGRWISSGDANVMLQKSSQSIFGVGDYWVWNGAMGYDITPKITAELSVNNLFNQNPPKYAITLAANAALGSYDYFGRAFVFKLRAKF